MSEEKQTYRLTIIDDVTPVIERVVDNLQKANELLEENRRLLHALVEPMQKSLEVLLVNSQVLPIENEEVATSTGDMGTAG